MSSVPRREDLVVDSLGVATIASPLLKGKNAAIMRYETDDRRILFQNLITQDRSLIDSSTAAAFELAGPREKIFFNPSGVNAAIVSCGGLCPGINNVIRSLFLHLHYGYKVKKVLGIKYGFMGMIPGLGPKPEELTPEKVRFIHEVGGSILGSSRGNQDAKKMVDYLEDNDISCLFTIGGDGTFRGASTIYEEITRRKKKISIIGIPKTIDNDIMYIDKTFGFETAFSEAVRAIRCAHIEAHGAPNGVGIVKLMGRHSGYIAAYAALALREVNLVLIPEQHFEMKNIFKMVRDRLEKSGHIVIVAAEGAGQHIFEKSTEKDASGNVKLHNIGVHLATEIKNHFLGSGMDINLKYIDPSYMIRALAATATDNVFTEYLGQFAADAAMAGKTGIAVGHWKGHYTHLPLKMATSGRNTISLDSELWRSVVKSTGQPYTM